MYGLARLERFAPPGDWRPNRIHVDHILSFVVLLSGLALLSLGAVVRHSDSVDL